MEIKSLKMILVSCIMDKRKIIIFMLLIILPILSK
jgi:hypothetical protein